jgi:hypothetical protein
MPRPFDRYQSFLNVPKPHELFLGGLSAHAISASLSSLFRMRLLRTAVATCFHPAGEFVGRDADARWAAARGRDVGVPTKRNSAIASNGARTVKMSERALKSLRDYAPSKLKVLGSNPGGVASNFNEIAFRVRIIPIGWAAAHAHAGRRHAAPL